MEDIVFPYAHKCIKCGKEVFPTPQWVYRRGNKYYCSWKCYRSDPPPKRKVVIPNIGDTIKIVYVSGIPGYTGKVGVVNHIDSMGQLHGTWGHWVIVPGEDRYKIIGEQNEH